jgi:hypothetical protein
MNKHDLLVILIYEFFHYIQQQISATLSLRFTTIKKKPFVNLISVNASRTSLIKIKKRGNSQAFIRYLHG